jgi:hypothetical protein
MVDIVSIVIAVISLAGSIISAGLTTLATLHSDRIKRLSQLEKQLSKYRDPLLLASIDLQSRLYNILKQDLLQYHSDPGRRDFIILYTAFLVGQYFSWAHILRRKLQFLNSSTDKKNRGLSRTMDAIQTAFSSDADEDLFMTWRGQQMAMGEIMTLTDNKELYCMGYSTFTERWKATDATFRGWFKPISEGIAGLVSAREQEKPMPTNRLRRLQHSLIDVIEILDPPGSRPDMKVRKKVEAAPGCECLNCPSKQSSQSDYP